MVTLNDLHLKVMEFKQKYKLFMYKLWFKWYRFKTWLVNKLNSITDRIGKILKKQNVIPEDVPTN